MTICSGFDDNNNAIPQLLKTEYSSLGALESAVPAGGHSINSYNYVLTFTGGRKFLCKTEHKLGERQLLAILELIGACRKGGAKVPTAIPADSGRMLHKCRHGVIYLLAFVDGTVFSGSIAELCDFARELAMLHRKLRSSASDYALERPEAQYAHPSPEALANIFARIEAESQKPGAKNNRNLYLTDILGNAGLLRRQYEKNMAEGERIDATRLTIQYIHNDLHPGNVLFRDGKTVLISDFNSMKNGELVRDVAFACHRFAFHNSAGTQESRKRMDAFLSAYMQCNSLTKEEQSTITHYFIDECLNRISYILNDYYKNNSCEWLHDISKHLANIKLAEEVALHD